MQKTITLILGLLVMAVFISGCSNGSQSPDFLAPSVAAPADDDPPDANETLAKEAGQQKIVYHIGPVDLPSNTEVKVMLEKPLSMRFQTDEAVWATGFVPKVVDANGGELPKELLHEAIISNAHEENPLCAGSPNPFFMASSILTEIKLPQGFGYPILPSDPLEAKVVLKNQTSKSYVNVYFELTLIAKPMNDFSAMSDVKPMLIELDPCKHQAPDVEPMKFVERKATYQIPIASSLILANGILQDYGSAISLVSGTDIMPFWRAETIKDKDHRLEALTANPFEDAGGIKFNVGDQITLSASYDNQSEIWLAGATAAAMVYVVPK